MNLRTTSLLAILLFACGEDDPASPANTSGGTAGQGGVAGKGNAGQGGTAGTQSQGGTGGTGGIQNGGSNSGGAGVGGTGGGGSELGGSGGSAGDGGSGGDGGTGGNAGTAGNAGSAGKQYLSECQKAHGPVGCCDGDTAYRFTTSGLSDGSTETADCASKGLTCGWNGSLYTCMESAKEDPSGKYTRDCSAPFSEEECKSQGSYCSDDTDCAFGVGDPWYCAPDQTCAPCVKDEHCANQPGTYCYLGNCKSTCETEDTCAQDGLLCDPVSKKCVECTSDNQCQYHCDPAEHRCTGCLKDSDCGAPGWSCKAGECIEACSSNKDCKGSFFGPACSPEGVCTTCVQDADCGKGKYCEPFDSLCVECYLDSHCTAPNHICNGIACIFHCTSDADCPDPKVPFCNKDGSCEECKKDADCTDPSAPYCYAGGCVLCSKDEQCPQPGTCAISHCIATCASDSDCKDPKFPVCDNDPFLPRCIECNVNADCAKKDPSHPYCANHACGECLTSFECSGGTQSCLLANGYGECGVPPEPCANSLYDPAPLTPAAAAIEGNVLPGGLSKIIIEDGTCAGFGNYAWHMVEVAEGDLLTTELSWTQGLPWRTYRLALFSEAGDLLGESGWGEAQTMTVHYLPAGKYFIRIEGIEVPDNQNTYLYQLKLSKSPGGCKVDSDCAFFHETERYRSQCTPTGSCGFLKAPKNVPQGGACDRTSDCVPGLYCLAELQLYNANPDTRSICTAPCTKDSDCPASLVCGAALPIDQQGQFCMPPCSSAEQCSVVPWKEPIQPTNAWVHTICEANRCTYSP